MKAYIFEIEFVIDTRTYSTEYNDKVIIKAEDIIEATKLYSKIRTDLNPNENLKITPMGELIE